MLTYYFINFFLIYYKILNFLVNSKLILFIKYVYNTHMNSHLEPFYNKLDKMKQGFDILHKIIPCLVLLHSSEGDY